MVLLGSYFFPYLNYFKGTKHGNVSTGKEYLFFYKQFKINLNNYLKEDLPNALNYIRAALGSIKKRHSRETAGNINDFVDDRNSEFFNNQRYLMALDIIHTKLFKEPKEIIKKIYS